MDRLKDCELIRSFKPHDVHDVNIEVLNERRSPVHQVQIAPKIVGKSIKLLRLFVVGEHVRLRQEFFSQRGLVNRRFKIRIFLFLIRFVCLFIGWLGLFEANNLVLVDGFVEDFVEYFTDNLDHYVHQEVK